MGHSHQKNHNHVFEMVEAPGDIHVNFKQYFVLRFVPRELLQLSI